MTKRPMTKPIPKPTHRDGPLVPLQGARFRVAVDESGLGLAGVFVGLNRGRRRLEWVYKQTLHHHYQGKGLRIRATVRARLAELLEAPEEWLAGEEVWAPYGVYLPLRDPIRRSLRVSLAVTRLAWQAITATQRDLAIQPGRAPTPEGYEPAILALSTMSAVLARLINIVRGVPQLIAWRPLLYTAPGALFVDGPTAPLPFESERVGTKSGEPLPPAVEQAYLAAVLAVTYLLEPWLRGQQGLNYSALLDVAEAVNPGKANFPPTFDHASNEDIARWARTARTSPYALIDWPAMEGRAPAPRAKGFPTKTASRSTSTRKKGPR